MIRVILKHMRISCGAWTTHTSAGMFLLQRIYIGFLTQLEHVKGKIEAVHQL